MTDIIAYDNNGKQLHLIDIGKRGGEGSIYYIAEEAGECAKIYHADKLRGELHDKIKAMVNYPPVDPTWKARKFRSIAWPGRVLYADRNRTQFIGFTMPLIDMDLMKESHIYFNTDDRIKYFGGSFTWLHLYYIALNLSSVVAAVHAAGHCVGDLREQNILVSKDGMVTLVDCDSFQIYNKADSKTYYTRVGTAEYLPPELLNVSGLSFSTGDYTRYKSDLFALGILIFKFLMNGVHPYQARGPAVDDAPSIMSKVQKGLYPYTNDARGVEPPIYAPSYKIIPPEIQKLFNRCFVEGHGNPDARPQAQEWTKALQREVKNIRKCKVNENHIFAGHLKNCPWCWIRETSGKDPFPEKAWIQKECPDVGKIVEPFDLSRMVPGISRLIAGPVGFIVDLVSLPPYDGSPPDITGSSQTKNPTSTLAIYRRFGLPGFAIAILVPCLVFSIILLDAVQKFVSIFYMEGLAVLMDKNYGLIIILMTVAIALMMVYGYTKKAV